LNQGSGYIKKYRPDLDFMDIGIAKNDYRELGRVLLEVDKEARRS